MMSGALFDQALGSPVGITKSWLSYVHLGDLEP